MYTYFKDMKNSLVVPLAYIIRKNESPKGIITDREQDIIKNPLPQGKKFTSNTKKVLAILKELPVDTDAET